MSRFEIEGLIGKANWHIGMCQELIAAWHDRKIDDATFQKRHRENLEFGIELCCEMREAGLDAHVDRLTGAVVDGGMVDLTEKIEGDGLRYMTFEWGNSHKEKA